MPEHLVWSVGNRLPAISENIVTESGAAVDLTGATVKFKMRRISSSTLKVDAAATVDNAAGGLVHYDWAAADVDTAGEYLVWWEVTSAGKTQDVGEALIEFRAHAPETNAYLELEEAKATLELGTGHADSDLLAALVAASRAVDELTGTRFYTTTGTEIRYYTPASAALIYIDDLNTLSEFAFASDGVTFSPWTENTDFILEPLNASLDAIPWHSVRLASRSTKSMVPFYPRSVRVTGKFGWASPPEAVRIATGIIATKVMVRARQAPLGVIAAFDGSAVRMSRFDPQVEELLAPYNRSTPFG